MKEEEAMRLFGVRREAKSSSISKPRRAGKRVLIVTGIMMALFMAAPVMNNSTLDTMTGTVTSYAAETATFSEYWFQDSNGSWKVRDNNGNVIKNAWLCDDAVASNGQDVWYLLDANGNMVTAGLVQDGTGNYYSLETNHNGYFGMLRYKSGNYDGVNLTLEGSHGGAFAAVLNQDGLNALKSKYGVTNVNIDNSNCVYTSSFRGGSGGGSTAGGNGGSTTAPQQNQSTSSSYSSTAQMYADLLSGKVDIFGGTSTYHPEGEGGLTVGDTSGYKPMH